MHDLRVRWEYEHIFLAGGTSGRSAENPMGRQRLAFNALEFHCYVCFRSTRKGG